MPKHLHDIKSLRDLAEYLGIALKSLSFLIYAKRDTLYHRFEIPKKSGGTRVIDSPNEKLKGIQRKVAHDLAGYYDPLPYVFGFIQKRSVVDNAKRHLKKEFILNVDLADFFPSIHFGRVRGLFMGSPFELPEKAATWLAQLVTHEKILPQGAPSSPIVSNMICLAMDKVLNKMAKSHGLTYSRYADDLSFSSNNREFPSAFAKVIYGSGDRHILLGDELAQRIKKCGFNINESKTRLLHRGMRQEVTGIIVNEKCNLPRKYLNTIRGELHRLNLATSEEEGELRQRVAGRIGHLKQVLGELDARYLRAKANLDGIPLTGKGKPEVFFRAATWIIANEDAHATAFFVEKLGWLTAAHLIDSPKDHTGSYKLFHPDRPDKEYPVEYIHHDTTMDYLVFSSKAKPIIRICLATELPTVGEKYWFAGYPTDLTKGNSVTVMHSAISGKRCLMGYPRYTIGEILFHGMSGGPVLNDKFHAVGIISHGTAESGDSVMPSTFTGLPEINAAIIARVSNDSVRCDNFDDC